MRKLAIGTCNEMNKVLLPQFVLPISIKTCDLIRKIMKSKNVRYNPKNIWYKAKNIYKANMWSNPNIWSGAVESVKKEPFAGQRAVHSELEDIM